MQKQVLSLYLSFSQIGKLLKVSLLPHSSPHSLTPQIGFLPYSQFLVCALTLDQAFTPFFGVTEAQGFCLARGAG